MRNEKGYSSTTISLDVSDSLLDESRSISEERGVSLYGQLRDFIAEGVRNYKRAKKGDSK